jgi:hypothetical protein
VLFMVAALWALINWELDGIGIESVSLFLGE